MYVLYCLYMYTSIHPPACPQPSQHGLYNPTQEGAQGAKHTTLLDLYGDLFFMYIPKIPKKDVGGGRPVTHTHIITTPCLFISKASVNNNAWLERGVGVS